MYGNLAETLTPEPETQLKPGGPGKPPKPPRTAVGTGGPPPDENREPHPESLPPRRRQPKIRNLPDMGVEVTMSTPSGPIVVSLFEAEGVVHIDASGPAHIPVQFFRGSPE